MTPARSRPTDPLARLNVAAFVDLVREVRAAQLADAAAGGSFATPGTSCLTAHLDEWLLDLGRPPALCVVWTGTEEFTPDTVESDD